MEASQGTVTKTKNLHGRCRENSHQKTRVTITQHQKQPGRSLPLVRVSLPSPMKYLYALVICTAWIAGIVIAKGFWSTSIACFFPPWALYLIIERILIILKFI